MSYFTKILRYERHHDTVTPVLATSVVQPDGSLKCIRVTELRFPVAPDAWDANPADWAAAWMDGYQAAAQFATRSDLIFAGDIESDVSGSVLPVLQASCSAPVYGAYLSLDTKAQEVHDRDRANSFSGCDNPWVASLFPGDGVGEESEAS